MCRCRTRRSRWWKGRAGWETMLLSSAGGRRTTRSSTFPGTPISARNCPADGRQLRLYHRLHSLPECDNDSEPVAESEPKSTSAASRLVSFEVSDADPPRGATQARSGGIPTASSATRISGMMRGDLACDRGRWILEGNQIDEAQSTAGELTSASARHGPTARPISATSGLR
jgi:hypothetical protein